MNHEHRPAIAPTSLVLTVAGALVVACNLGGEDIDFESPPDGSADGGGDVSFDAPHEVGQDVGDGGDQPDFDTGCPLITWFRDVDGDQLGDTEFATASCVRPEGYVANDDDCDDTRADIGAAERTYLDNDEDGFGDRETYVEVCTPTIDYVANDDDCDDTRASVAPNRDERCSDGRDNDCDGLIDESGAVDARPWYLDGDGDGHGRADIRVESCEDPSNDTTRYAAAGNDCDDGNPGINPSAVEDDCNLTMDLNCDGSVGFVDRDDDGFDACEECNDLDDDINPDATEVCDLVDNDCDGDIDEAGAADAATWYFDNDEDGWGVAADAVTSCGNPTGRTLQVGDCNDDDAQVNPEVIERCGDGIDQDCDGRECAPVGTVLLGDAFPGFGVPDVSFSQSCVGDFDGDDVLDLVATTSNDGEQRGLVAIWFGPFGQSEEELRLPDHSLVGEPGDNAAYSCAVGDFDGNGTDDVVVGARGFQRDTHQGAAFFLPDRDELLSATRLPDDAVGMYIGPGMGHGGIDVHSVGDLTGDGVEDLALGYALYSGWNGITYLSSTIPQGEIVVSDDMLTLENAGGDGFWLGVSAANPLDMNGDGQPDVHLTTVSNISGVFLGPISENQTSASFDVRLTSGSPINALTGLAIVTEDLDGNETRDLAVAEPGWAAADGALQGRLLLIPGPVATPSTLSVDDEATRQLHGANGDLASFGLFHGDLNGDQQIDLIVNAPGSDLFVGTGHEAGHILILYGPLDLAGPDAPLAEVADADLLARGRDPSRGAVVAVGSVADFNNDGFDDLLVATQIEGLETRFQIVYGGAR